MLVDVKAPSPPEKLDKDGTKAPSPVTPFIYVSGERVAEGVTPTTIQGKVVVYSSRYIHVGDEIHPVPTVVPQTYPRTSIDVNGLHVEIKAPSSSSPPSMPPPNINNANPQPPIITSGPFPNIVAQQNYHIVLNCKTIIAGGPAQTISETQISLASAGMAIIVGKYTSQIPNRSNLSPNATPPIITLSLGSSTYTIPLSTNLIISAAAASNSQLAVVAAATSPTLFIVLQGQTLLAGGDGKLISGSLVSFLPSATALLLAGTVIPVSKSAPDPRALAVIVIVIALTLESSKYTATLSSSDPFIASKSGIVAWALSPGSVITVGGRLILLDDDASHSGGRRVLGGLGAMILGEFYGNNHPDLAYESISTPVARVILVGSQKQTITPTSVLVGRRTVYIYPSGTVLVMSVGGGGTNTIITTNTATGSGGSPFLPRTTATGGSNTSSNASGMEFNFTGSTSLLRLSSFCGGWVYWERITRMILEISLSVIIAY